MYPFQSFTPNYGYLFVTPSVPTTGFLQKKEWKDSRLVGPYNFTEFSKMASCIKDCM